MKLQTPATYNIYLPFDSKAQYIKAGEGFLPSFYTLESWE